MYLGDWDYFKILYYLFGGWGTCSDFSQFHKNSSQLSSGKFLMKHAFGEELHLNKIFILAIFLFNFVALFPLSEHREMLISAKTCLQGIVFLCQPL